jgi:hypothetical protein
MFPSQHQQEDAMDYTERNQRDPLTNPAYTKPIELDPTGTDPSSSWWPVVGAVAVAAVIAVSAINWYGTSENAGTNSLATPPDAIQTPSTSPVPSPTTPAP